MPVILAVSNDEYLLRTRAMVLELTGAAVISASPDEAALLLQKQQFDLIVLCHTVNSHDRDKLELSGKTLSPLPQVLSLGTNGFIHPRELIQKAANMLDICELV